MAAAPRGPASAPTLTAATASPPIMLATAALRRLLERDERRG